GERHAEAAGVRRRDQLFRIAAFLPLEPGAEAECPAEGSALAFKVSLSVSELALPRRYGIAGRHHGLRLAVGVNDSGNLARRRLVRYAWSTSVNGANPHGHHVASHRGRKDPTTGRNDPP